MVGLQLPNSHTHILIAAAIAHFNGGYFQQNDPPGWIMVEGEERLKIEREQIVQALGRSCSDELWHSLVEHPQGQVVEHTTEVIVIEEDT